MNWKGAVISDSGGFQIMTLAKQDKAGKVADQGVTFKPNNHKKILFTPEDSIGFQMLLKPDMLVALDDFTPPKTSYRKAKETVDRTIHWAKRSKEQFLKICRRQGLQKTTRPYLLAVVQGGDYLDLRKECAQRLAEIGFDGFGYGGWPLTTEGKFNYQVAQVIADSAPNGYLLFGLGIGKPEEIAGCVKMGYHIFDCVLPTRDARHKRLYVFKAKKIEDINVTQPNFYSFYTPDKNKHLSNNKPVSSACDCLLCQNYSRSYLTHLFRVKEMSALRLATIHNLRFYSLLMEKLTVS